jgi:hypothetical protein
MPLQRSGAVTLGTWQANETSTAGMGNFLVLALGTLSAALGGFFGAVTRRKTIHEVAEIGAASPRFDAPSTASHV